MSGTASDRKTNSLDVIAVPHTNISPSPSSHISTIALSKEEIADSNLSGKEQTSKAPEARRRSSFSDTKSIAQYNTIVLMDGLVPCTAKDLRSSRHSNTTDVTSSIGSSLGRPKSKDNFGSTATFQSNITAGSKRSMIMTETEHQLYLKAAKDDLERIQAMNRIVYTYGTAGRRKSTTSDCSAAIADAFGQQHSRSSSGPVSTSSEASETTSPSTPTQLKISKPSPHPSRIATLPRIDSAETETNEVSDIKRLLQLATGMNPSLASAPKGKSAEHLSLPESLDKMEALYEAKLKAKEASENDNGSKDAGKLEDSEDKKKKKKNKSHSQEEDSKEKTKTPEDTMDR
ncbi:hypothetical protein HDU97_004582 [Phlyctochytrium planicorne]|nr:hypothetical protein HDU97_004582 [Phlyctochytrium planicorne]